MEPHAIHSASRDHYKPSDYHVGPGHMFGLVSTATLARRPLVFSRNYRTYSSRRKMDI